MGTFLPADVTRESVLYSIVNINASMGIGVTVLQDSCINTDRFPLTACGLF